MTLKELSAKLRQIRSEMPRVTSEQAYAQMDRLMGRTNSIPQPTHEFRESQPLGSSASTQQRSRV